MMLPFALHVMHTKMVINQALLRAALFISSSKTLVKMPVKHKHVMGTSSNQEGHSSATQVEPQSR